MPTFVPILNSPINFSVVLKTLPTKGKLVYEYNPFRNYRLSEDIYELNGKEYTLEQLKNKGITVSHGGATGIEFSDNSVTLKYEKGLLVDFITDLLNFSLEHPVHIIPQASYDGSVNLIINDGLNIPRLINSRFSATGKNTYEIVDRKGNNDTNIYDSGDQFDIDTSLYKRVSLIPKLEFRGVLAGGNLKVGNYHFYFKFSDADGNETDFVAESGLVSVFIGYDYPSSITSGLANENSTKQVKFRLSNIDASYDYVTVYYSRNTGETTSLQECAKINKKYTVNSFSIANIVITGFEDITEIPNSDINLQYNIVDAVGTSATCLNMLFMANVHKPDLPYDELTLLALRFRPYLKEELYELDMNSVYSISSNKKGYYDPKYIYDKTGYWGNELYRFGIVFIMPNNQLTPVFNIRGGCNIKPWNESDYLYSNFDLYDEDDKTIKQITILENTGYILADDTTLEDNTQNVEKSTVSFENAKGVVMFSPTSDTNKIYGVDIRADEDVINELKKYVKGYFFVRQKRIPTILAQGITIGIDKEARIPTIPTVGGVVTECNNKLASSYVETENINGINYISEGFLTRYYFTLEKKGGSLLGKIGKVVGIVVAMAASVASTIVTMGGASIAVAGTIVLATGALAGTAMGLAAAGLAIYQAIKAGESYTLKGRKTDIPGGMKRVEEDNSRLVGGAFRDRVIIKDHNYNKIEGILCPDFELNLAYYNQIFTGNSHIVRSTKSLGVNILANDGSNYFSNSDRHFYIPSYYDSDINHTQECKIVGVPDNVKAVGIENTIFRSRAGEAEEVWRYENVAQKFEQQSEIKINSDIVRGAFGPYLAVQGLGQFPAETVEILIPGYGDLEDHFQIRMNDKSSYYAISERITASDLLDYLVNKSANFNGGVNSKEGYTYQLYRGDCYLCQFTHRINRNFNDPSALYNDEIISQKTWKENYDPAKPEKYSEINLGDVNAVELGMWVTFRVRSSYNLNIRTLDKSNVDEDAMTGHPRGYYPYLPMSTEGIYKTPEAQIYNKGFVATTSERWNFELPNVPHIKNWFGTRIMYSDIHVNDAYKNGFRVFLGSNYRDYTREYGEIVKLVSFESSLLCVFEHGMALVPVNERALAGEGMGGNVFINTSNVLPENPLIISDMFGSLWPESVLKVPGKTGDAKQYVYGVDTVAKKIWRTDGLTLLCISDFKVQEFLNNNITLGERELTPKIGIRNVKTVYNAFKRDVMFTFYDNTYGFEEKVWNLCWNELLEKFITFYSWVPSAMENINNIPFSFDRNTSKWIAKLATSHTKSSFADGITVSNVIVNNNPKSEEVIRVENYEHTMYYTKKDGSEGAHTIKLTDEGWDGASTLKDSEILGNLQHNLVGFLSLSNRVLSKLDYNVDFELLPDQYLNYKLFKVAAIGSWAAPEDAKYQTSKKIYGLYLYEEDPYIGVQLEDGTSILVNGEDVITVNPNRDILYSELYYRNSKKVEYADFEESQTSLNNIPIEDIIKDDLPIFKDKAGKRPTLPYLDLLNPDKIVRFLNIRANISMTALEGTDVRLDYYNILAGYESGTSLIDMGSYESVVAIAPEWNLLFLSTDFWKHGQSGIIDITDDIYPTYWYGKQHPFEFECMVVNDPSVHKIFTNLELIANKAKPESFHYEIVGECYDFAKDKPNMYFRLEAMKALWLYNGVDISYNRNFLKTKLKQQNKSADLIKTYFSRKDTINEIEDYYIAKINATLYDYRHLSGAEIVYYPTRLEYRIWNHAQAVDAEDQDTSRALIASNCRYLEDKWRIQINPIIVAYKNEYSYHETPDSTTNNKKYYTPLFRKENSDWINGVSGESLPPLTLFNSPIPNEVKLSGEVTIPGGSEGKDNALYNLYEPLHPYDTTNWLNDSSIYKTSFGEAQNRKEVDVKDKFLKVRIRYSGEELAIIDCLKTIYLVSYA